MSLLSTREQHAPEGRYGFTCVVGKGGAEHARGGVLAGIQELKESVNKKGKHNAVRSSYRRRYEDRPEKVVIGEHRVEVPKPQAETVDSKEVMSESGGQE